MSLPCLSGEVKSVRITTEQLALIARALRHSHLDPQFTSQLTTEELFEVGTLATCCADVSRDVHSAPDMVYGFAL